MVLGIDTSTSCGFAVLRRDGTRMQSGVVNLAPRGEEGPGARFVRLHDMLDALLRTWRRLEVVAYEIPGLVRTRDVALSLFGITTHVESWAERNSLGYYGFAPAEVKRALGLKGNAEKHEVVAAAERLWSPHAITKDDEADALACALALLKEGR